jgi:endonuclease YncB( thermonuclease family)
VAGTRSSTRRRVRLLGIDTPELKEQQPHAQEAKDYTKGRCDKQTVWLTYGGSERTDHYGRTLAFVWVKEGSGGYLCVNEGIVAAGLAKAYVPNATTAKLFNWDKMLKLQDSARNAKRGMWSTFVDEVVYKTANGSAYHVKTCEHLANIRNLYDLKASEAAAKGLHPCRTCMT